MFQIELVMLIFVILFLFVLSMTWLSHLIIMGPEHGSLIIHPFHLFGASTIPLLIAWRSFRKNKLDFLGASFAYFIGFTTFLTSFSLFCALMAFFYSSNLFTKWKSQRKVNNDSSSNFNFKMKIKDLTL